MLNAQCPMLKRRAVRYRSSTFSKADLKVRLYAEIRYGRRGLVGPRPTCGARRAYREAGKRASEAFASTSVHAFRLQELAVAFCAA